MSDAVFDIPTTRRATPVHVRHARRKEFGQDVAGRRKEQGMTREVFARKAGVTIGFLAALESGEEIKNSTHAMLHKVAVALSCELALDDFPENEYYGASTTVEELLRMGIIPRLQQSS